MTCTRCHREATEDNPVLPGLFVYLRLSVPAPLCLECIEALHDQREESSDLEDIA